MPIRAAHVVVTSDFDIFGVTIFKTATESVTSSITLQNDDQLFFAVAANSRYTFEGFVVYDGATAGDLNVDITVPTGSTFGWSNFGNTGPDAGTSLTDYNTVLQAASDARKINVTPTPSPPGLSFRPAGFLFTGSTAGTMQLRWAQGTSNATATRLQAGSWIRLSKVS